MKKILTVSLLAFMAVGVAHADIASTTYVKSKISDLDVAEIKAENEVILSVSETDGKISATTGKITESHLDFDVATQGELDAVSQAAQGAQTTANQGVSDAAAALAAAQGAQTTANQGVTDAAAALAAAQGAQTTANQGVTDAAAALAAAQGAQSTANTAKSTADTNAARIGTGQTDDGSDTLIAAINNALAIGDRLGELGGLKTSASTAVEGINEVYDMAEAAQRAANTAQGAADLNADVIGAELEEEMGVYSVANLNTTAKTLVGAINEADSRAGSAYNLAAEAKSAADANAAAIGTMSELTTDARTLVGAIDEVKGYAEFAQGTADMKVDKTSLGIVETADNPFIVPSWCKGAGVVCSFVVLDGVAGWQKVVDEDPV